MAAADAFFKQSYLSASRHQVGDVTAILSRIKNGDGQAAEELLPIVYDQLRRLAGQQMGWESPGWSLQATELVHEAYLRLVGSDQRWEGKPHFFAAAAEAMRRILVERARARKALKRGGDRRKVQLHDSVIEASKYEGAPDEILMVNELFDLLAEQHPDEANVAKLRYFAGFNVSEAAKALEIPVSTAHQHWNYARAWLYREFKKGDATRDL